VQELGELWVASQKVLGWGDNNEWELGGMMWENVAVAALMTRVQISQRVWAVVRGCGHRKMKKQIRKEGLLPLNLEPESEMKSNGFHQNASRQGYHVGNFTL
jgi:hypothetical protein